MTTSARSSFGARTLVPALLFATAPAVAAQVGDVWVVDAASGPGSDFATIQAAVDAASAGDTVLVRSGAYPSFSLISKNLAVVADAGAQVRVADGPRVSFTPQGAPNVLHGLDFARTPTEDPVAWIATGDFGANTWVSDCTTRGAYVYVSSSSAVLDHCVFRGADAADSSGFGAQAALDQGISFVAAFASEFHGGDGYDANGAVAPTPGAPAVLADTSFWAAHSTLVGGQGGDGAFDPVDGCQDAQSGGAAVFNEGWFLTNSNVLAGGPGGAAAPGCTSGPGATGVDVEQPDPYPYAQVVDSDVPAPLLSTPGVAREGQALTLGWDGPAGVALVLVSAAVEFEHSLYDPLSPGSMPLLLAPPYKIFVAGVLSAPGSASVSLTVPELGAGIESLRIYAQALHLDPTAFTVHSGGARATVLLDGSF